MSEALRPSNFQSLSSLTQDENQELEQVKEEEDGMAYIARTQGWETLKEFMAEQVEILDQMVVEAMDKGLSFEELGKRTAVKELTKDVIRRIISRVEDARRASDSRVS